MGKEAPKTAKKRKYDELSIIKSVTFLLGKLPADARARVMNYLNSKAQADHFADMVPVAVD